MELDWGSYYFSDASDEASVNLVETPESSRPHSATSSLSLASTVVGSITGSWSQESEEMSASERSASDFTISDESNGDIEVEIMAANTARMGSVPEIAHNVEIQALPIEAANDGVMNWVPTSSTLVDTPSKKRKLDTPIEKSLSEIEEDGATCSICFEFFDLIGLHRLVCLKCGHCFGESCIRRWIKEQPSNQKCCPGKSHN